MGALEYARRFISLALLIALALAHVRVICEQALEHERAAVEQVIEIHLYGEPELPELYEEGCEFDEETLFSNIAQYENNK